MEAEFIPYEQALALKELGFDEPCFKAYTEEYKGVINFSNTHTNTSVKNTLPTKPFTAPLYQQAFRWFREKYSLFGHVLAIKERNYEWRIQNIKYLQDRRHFTLADIGGGQIDNTYEEAELECLKKLIEICKNN